MHLEKIKERSKGFRSQQFLSVPEHDLLGVMGAVLDIHMTLAIP